MTRRAFIAGNWKMNLDRRAALRLVGALAEGLAGDERCDVAVCPPFVYIDEVARTLAGSRIRVGAQDLCEAAEGAFTGEVSARMLRDVGAELSIVGHSERRHVYGESDELVRSKLRAALDEGLEAILCVGETLEDRQAGQTESVIARQLTQGLSGVDEDELGRVTIAYEPVWAIGTGQNATPAQASDAHAYLRGVLSGLYDDARADLVRIQYGGSVKPANAAELLNAREVDGALVGGASLEPDSFLQIVRSC